MKHFDELILNFPPLDEKEITSSRGGSGPVAWSLTGPTVTIVGDRNTGDIISVTGGTGYSGGNDSSSYNANNPTGTGSGSGAPGPTTALGTALSAIENVVSNPDFWKDVGTVVVGTAEEVTGLVSEELTAGASTFVVLDGFSRQSAGIQNLLHDIDADLAPGGPGNLGGQIGSLTGNKQYTEIGSMVSDGMAAVLTGGIAADVTETWSAFKEGETMKFVISANDLQDTGFTIHEYIMKIVEGGAGGSGEGASDPGDGSTPETSYTPSFSRSN